MGTTAYDPLRHFSFGKRHPVYCSHTSMVRVFLRSTDSVTCQTCKRPNHLGWVYACTVDRDNAATTTADEEREREKMLGLKRIGNASASESANIGNVSGDASAAQNAEEDIELSPWISKAVENRYYTKEQTDTIKAQRAAVMNLAEKERVKGKKDEGTLVGLNSARSLRKPYSLLNLRDGTKHVGTKLKRAWKASTEMLKRPTYEGLCTMQRCHHCYPAGGDRTWQSLNEICSPSYAKPIVPSSIDDIPADQIPRVSINKIIAEMDQATEGYKDIYGPRDSLQTSTSESWDSASSTTIRHPNYNDGDDEPDRHYDNYDPKEVTYWSTMPLVGDDVANADDVSLNVSDGAIDDPQDPYEPRPQVGSSGEGWGKEVMRSIDEALSDDGDKFHDAMDSTGPEEPGYPCPLDDQLRTSTSKEQNGDKENNKGEPEQAISDMAVDQPTENLDDQDAQSSLRPDFGQSWLEERDNSSGSSSYNTDTDTDTENDESGDDLGGKRAGSLDALPLDFTESNGGPELDTVGNGEDVADDKDTGNTALGTSDGGLLYEEEVRPYCLAADVSEKGYGGDEAGIGAAPETDEAEASYEETGLFWAPSDCPAGLGCGAEPDTDPNVELDAEPDVTEPNDEPHAEPHAESKTKPNDATGAESKGTAQPEPKPEPEPFIIPNIIVTDYDEEQAFANAIAAAKRAEIDSLAAFVRSRNNRQYLGPPARLTSSHAFYPFASASSSTYPYHSPSHSFSSPSFRPSTYNSLPVAIPNSTYSVPSYSYSSPSTPPRYYSTNKFPSLAHYPPSFVASSSGLAAPTQPFASNSSSFNRSSSTPGPSTSSSRIPRRSKADKVLSPKDRTELHSIQESSQNGNEKKDTNRSFGANITNGAKTRGRYRPCAGWMPGQQPRAGTVPRVRTSVSTGATTEPAVIGPGGPSMSRRPAFVRWGGKVRPSPSGGGGVNDGYELFPRMGGGSGSGIEMEVETEREIGERDVKGKGKEREHDRGLKGKRKENEG